LRIREQHRPVAARALLRDVEIAVDVRFEREADAIAGLKFFRGSTSIGASFAPA
jgi:hypothetical protein